MTRISLLWRAAGFALTIFLSAFLVFQVQPVISKMILPWFGGTPAVWTTCVLFFQIVLFGGYAYAHLTSRYLSLRNQGLLHLVLLAAALLTLPIAPADSWKPQDGTAPTGRILLLLLANVGLPYFLLSTTGPLLQSWFARTQSGRSPYRLYALSNVGSLAALLSYPFLFEPLCATWVQDGLWSAGFCAFACACAVLAIQSSRFTQPNSAAATAQTSAAEEQDTPDFVQRFGWLAFPALASMTLLATTNHVCQDVAVVPFLWVAPLALYLLTFIICFERESWYSRRWIGGAAVVAILAVCLSIVDDSLTRWLAAQGLELPLGRITNHLLYETVAYLAAMFLICLVCHGELVRSKPAAGELTLFYLLSAAGGAVGGTAVAILCPLVFSTFVEMQISLSLGVTLAACVLWLEATESYLANRAGWQKVTRIAAIVLCFLVMRVQFASIQHGSRVTLRNFYGVLRVDDFTGDSGDLLGRTLIHGSTIHGFQFGSEDRRHWPTTYYSPQSGIGLTLKQLRQGEPLRVGVVGLGCGTLAAYGQPGDCFRFYEINPQVRDVALEHFTYLKDSAARVEVVLGDARLSLEAEAPQQFDVLVLDAFSSDAIPAHLLTREAFALYLRHLRPEGVIAVHTSNRHLNLPPVVSRLALYHGWEDGMIVNRNDPERHALGAQWMLVTRNRSFLEGDVIRGVLGQIRDPRIRAQAPLWTDQYNNLFEILRVKSAS